MNSFILLFLRGFEKILRYILQHCEISRILHVWINTNVASYNEEYTIFMIPMVKKYFQRVPPSTVSFNIKMIFEKSLSIKVATERCVFIYVKYTLNMCHDITSRLIAWSISLLCVAFFTVASKRPWSFQRGDKKDEDVFDDILGNECYKRFSLCG